MIDTLHIRPAPGADDHLANDDCWCGPTCEPVQREDGTIGWLYVHHRVQQAQS